MKPERTLQNQRKGRTPECPICRQPLPYDLRDPNPPSYFPFCSQKCKLIDLHKWLSEEYSVSSPTVPTEEDNAQKKE